MHTERPLIGLINRRKAPGTRGTDLQRPILGHSTLALVFFFPLLSPSCIVEISLLGDLLFFLALAVLPFLSKPPGSLCHSGYKLIQSLTHYIGA